MTKTKYFQKVKCDCKDFYDNECVFCGNTKEIKGADITQTIKPILEEIENNKRSVEQYGYGAFNKALQKANQIIEGNVVKVEE